MSKEMALQLAAMTLAIGVLAWHAWETMKLRGAIENDTAEKKKMKEMADQSLAMQQEALRNQREALGIPEPKPNLEVVKEKPADVS